MRERRSELYQRALVADALDAGDSAFGKLAAPLPLAGDVPCLEAACIEVERGLTCRNEKSTISISPATSVQATAGSFGSRLFEDGERFVAMVGEVLLALDGTVPPASMDGEGGVSQGGEGLGGVAGSGAAGVLAAGPIADVVQAVLDSPMPSRDVEQ